MNHRKGKLSEDIGRVISNWMNPQYMKLHAGEMSAQEVRTTRAVVDCVGREIQALLTGHDYPDFCRAALAQERDG